MRKNKKKNRALEKDKLTYNRPVFVKPLGDFKEVTPINLNFVVFCGILIAFQFSLSPSSWYTYLMRLVMPNGPLMAMGASQMGAWAKGPFRPQRRRCQRRGRKPLFPWEAQAQAQRRNSKAGPALEIKILIIYITKSPLQKCID